MAHRGAGVAGLTADESWLACLQGDEGPPPLSIGPVSFDDWWNRSIIRDQAGADFTRRARRLEVAEASDPDLRVQGRSTSWLAGADTPLPEQPVQPMAPSTNSRASTQRAE
jgi:hypothetical protein